MAINTLNALGTILKATHHQGGIYGDERAVNGLYAHVPIDLLMRRDFSIYYTDFHNLESEYVATNITSGTIDIVQDLECGFLRLDATTANQGLGSVQYTGGDLSSEGVANPGSGRTIMFEIGVQCNLWDDSDWFVGLAETDTTFMSAAGAPLANGGDNMIGFRHLEAGTGVPIPCYAGTAVANLTAPTTTYTSALAADSYHRFGARIEGTNRVRFWIDGSPVTDWVTMGTAFDDAMTPTFAMIANGTQVLFDVDYVLVCQQRGI